jgi:hypothetical protein
MTEIKMLKLYALLTGGHYSFPCRIFTYVTKGNASTTDGLFYLMTFFQLCILFRRVAGRFEKDELESTLKNVVVAYFKLLPHNFSWRNKKRHSTP